MTTPRGQYTLEMAVVMTAVVVGVILMHPYVHAALRAGAKMIEMQFNGAINDNPP